MRDCIFLVADSNMKATFEGFLCRDQFHKSLGCGSFHFDINQDIVVAGGNNDPGIYVRGHELARLYTKTHDHCLVVLDTEWEGSPKAVEIKNHITSNLLRSEWNKSNCRVIVIDPELENWIWQRNNHVATAIGLNSANDFTRAIDSSIWPNNQAKPKQPKETLDAVLRTKDIPRSSAIYKKITSKVSVRNCQDSAFQELLLSLQTWFPTGKDEYEKDY